MVSWKETNRSNYEREILGSSTQIILDFDGKMLAFFVVASLTVAEEDRGSELSEKVGS